MRFKILSLLLVCGFTRCLVNHSHSFAVQIEIQKGNNVDESAFNKVDFSLQRVILGEGYSGGYRMIQTRTKKSDNKIYMGEIYRAVYREDTTALQLVYTISLSTPFCVTKEITLDFKQDRKKAKSWGFESRKLFFTLSEVQGKYVLSENCPSASGSK